MNPENHFIPSRPQLPGHTTKQPLSNFEPQKPWKYKQLRGPRTDLRTDFKWTPGTKKLMHSGKTITLKVKWSDNQLRKQWFKDTFTIFLKPKSNRSFSQYWVIFKPLSGQYFFSIPSGNTRQHSFLWCFQRV